MGTKQIIDLMLRSNVDATCNFPVDDTTQAYRVTGAQLKSFLTGALQVKSVDYTVQVQDGIILFDDTSTDRVCTLPAAASNIGRTYKIGNVSSDKGKVTIAALGGLELDCKGSYVTCVSDGAAYHILDIYFPQKEYDVSATDIEVRNFQTSQVITNKTIGAATLTPLRVLNKWHVKAKLHVYWATPASNSVGITLKDITSPVADGQSSSPCICEAIGDYNLSFIVLAGGSGETPHKLMFRCDSSAQSLYFNFFGEIVFPRRPAFIE